MNLLSKLIFFLKRPPIVIVAGQDRVGAKSAISLTLKQEPKISKETLFFESDLENIEDFKFLVKNSSLPILVVTGIGDISCAKIRELAGLLPVHGFLILDFDDETVREIGAASNAKTLTFGFQEADFRASDIKHNGGINFKINYKGNIVPFWLENASEGEENKFSSSPFVVTREDKEIYYALAAAAAATVFGLNLVEISQTLKNCVEKNLPV